MGYMNLQPRIISITAGLTNEYLIALESDLEPFERLITRIETALRVYRDRCDEQSKGYKVPDTKEWS